MSYPFYKRKNVKTYIGCTCSQVTDVSQRQTTNGASSSPSSGVSSQVTSSNSPAGGVQAALAALQTGQLSLNQVQTVNYTDQTKPTLAVIC